MSFLSLRKLAAAAVFLTAAMQLFAAQPEIRKDNYIYNVDGPRTFILAGKNRPTLPVIIDDADYTCVKKAAEMFCSDINAITGRADTVKLTNQLPADKPGKSERQERSSTGDNSASSYAVIVGTLGHSTLIDRLVKDGKLDVSKIKGKWEHTLWTLITDPFPEVDFALVIAGSDRRGTAYGLMTISEKCGMSPWHWWADVPPRHSDMLSCAIPKYGENVIDAPKVKYRGIFINDEDWALHEWAKNNFEKDGFKRIGPKTNEKIFELMLRLRMNYFWPAMHDVSVEFGAVPENPVLADQYGIVMGASHCEPMLRNNCHWKKEDGEWNYITNQAKIDSYWKESVDQRGDKEAVWTLGIRGIHDSAMAGANTMDEKKALVSKAITNQRAMLDAGVSKEWGPIAQCFVPYKEVLSIYDAGLEVPEDVTLVWVDDNYGYIRRLSNPEEQKRSGGSGVYYHISYYGGPHSYCELNTTPPGLMQVELRKAWDNNARDLWVLNVGDLKLMEIGVDYFARLAWDPVPRLTGGIDGLGLLTGDNMHQKEYLRTFIENQFGRFDQYMGDTLDDYFQLGFFRKPEEMSQAWANDLRDDQVPQLKKAYEILIAEARLAEMKIQSQDQADAWFELIGYQAQYLGNAGLIFLACRESSKQGKNLREAAEPYIRAIDENRARFSALHGGKWAGFLPDTVRNRTTNNEWWTHMQWPWNDRPGPHWGNTAHKNGWSADLNATLATGLLPIRPEETAWIGLDLGTPGYTLSSAAASVSFDEKDEKAPALNFTFNTDKAEANALIDFLPSYALYPGRQTRVSIWLNGDYLRTVAVPNSDSANQENGPRSTQILDNFARVVVPLKNLKQGENTFTVRAVDPGVSIRTVYLPNK